MEKSQLENYHVHYGPAQGWSQVDLHELWRYKDLIWLFVKRDFNVMYKQTVLGPAWILINPLLSTAMYCVMFGVIAQLSTDGVPQILFYLAGTALWGFFAACINKVSGTFTTNSNIFSKVYFPRLAMPLSTMLSGLINFLVQFVLFFALLLVYLAKGEVSPQWALMPLAVPLVLQVGLLGLGCGVIVWATAIFVAPHSFAAFSNASYLVLRPASSSEIFSMRALFLTSALVRKKGIPLSSQSCSTYRASSPASARMP